jgi:hypothetical protein
MESTQTAGFRRIVGVSGGAVGWLFDIICGFVIAGFVAGIPLSVLDYFVGNPAYLLTVAQLVASGFGIRFMRRARTETGPVWFRK